MALSIENYISPLAPSSLNLRRSGLLVWLAVSLLLILWIALIISAPLAMAYGMWATAKTIYVPFSYICHQIDDRSFHLFGYKLAVCARCFGIYAGLAIGTLLYPLFRAFNNTEPLPRLWLILAPVPTAIDWLLGIFKIWENTHTSRFITGAIMGAILVFFIMPGLVDISQYFFKPKMAKQSNLIKTPLSSVKNDAPTDYSRPDLRI